MNVLLVSPYTPDTFWSLKHAVRFISRKAAFPPLGLLTVAAMLPRAWNLRLVDLNVCRLRDADLLWADYVMIGAMIVHRNSVEEIIARAEQFQRTVIGGGPLFTTGHEAYAGRVHSVLGEAEDIIPALIADMESGTLKDSYLAPNWPDVSTVPVPRWDLIRLRDYATMAVQFSRGCPYDCEFCDVIVMNGRRPRTKTPIQTLAELEALAAAGWKNPVFIVDDNFIGNRVRVKELLGAIIAWRRSRLVQFPLLTEASINLADDAELLGLMVDAGFRTVFVGIETPNSTSLVECNKTQNVGRDMAQAIQVIQNSGLEVMGGFIVGFDNDPREIFELLFDFIQRTGVATAMVGLLTALPKTRLYHRLLGEGRLKESSTGNNTEAVLNFIPRLDRDFLLGGYRQLMKTLYEPGNYYKRVLTFLSQHQPHGRGIPWSWSNLRAFARSLWTIGVVHRGRGAFWKYLATVAAQHPRNSNTPSRWRFTAITFAESPKFSSTSILEMRESQRPRGSSRVP